MQTALLLAVSFFVVVAARGESDDVLLNVDFSDADHPAAVELAGKKQNEILPSVGRDGTPGLRTLYVGGDMGSERVVTRPKLPRPVLEATLSFDVRFADDFQFVMGGKLHGLGPTAPTTGGEPTKPNGWSTRLMWRAGGVLQTYVYDQRKTTKWGDSVNAADFAFETGRWYELTMHTKVNDPPEAANGFVHVYVDGEKLIEHNNLQLRAVGDDDTLINRLMFSTFHGGNGPEWAPKNENGSFATLYADFDNFRVVKGPPAK